MKKRMEILCIDPMVQLDGMEIYKLLHEQVIPVTIDGVNWSGYSYVPEVVLRMAYTREALILSFDVKEKHVRALAMEDHGAVWEDSCVEFFVADPVGEGYYNFELNCIGTGLAAHRYSRNEFTLFSKEKMDQWLRYSSLKHEPMNKYGDEECWWVTEVIPFSLLGLKNVPESLHVNFYKCGDKCERPHFLSWSPICTERPDFHRPEFFGEIRLK